MDFSGKQLPKIKIQKICALIFLINAGLVYAGTGYFIKFMNNTTQDITLSLAGADSWYPNDFANDTTIPALSSKTLYTEDKGNGDGIVGLDLEGAKLNKSHIEVWEGSHQHSVTQNKSSDAIHFPNAGYTSVNIGSNNSQILTSIRLTSDGAYGTAYSTVSLSNEVPLIKGIISPSGGYKEGSAIINEEMTIQAGYALSTYDSSYELIMAENGNLLLYRCDTKHSGCATGRIIWETATQGHSNAYAKFQKDGNFVVYDSDGKPIWASSHDGNYSLPQDSSSLYLQNDGNLVIYAKNGKSVWASDSNSKLIISASQSSAQQINPATLQPTNRTNILPW